MQRGFAKTLRDHVAFTPYDPVCQNSGMTTADFHIQVRRKRVDRLLWQPNYVSASLHIKKKSKKNDKLSVNVQLLKIITLFSADFAFLVMEEFLKLKYFLAFSIC